MHRIQQSILRYALMLLATGLVATTTSIAAVAAASSAAPPATTRATYSDDEVTQAANDFFKNGAQDLGKVLQKVLKEKGQPAAIIRGEEAGGAIGVGLRYGHGELIYKGGVGRKVYWQGPSLGFDVNYVQNAGSVIAPVRFGVGWRQGVAVGYMHFSPQKRINPF